MTEAERERLRVTFTEDAELYDRARPGYPPQLFDDLAALAALGPACRVLEIGCGTGQATMPLAERACKITAVELGADMVAVARRNLAGFPSVQVVHAAFEDWPLPSEPFDLVISATAFHWVDPAVRVAKSADALRVGGTLATVSTRHVAGGSDAFFIEVQDCYERFDPMTTAGLRLPVAAEIAEDSAELDGSGRFGPASFHRYEWELSYPTAQYLDTLRTYSGHRALGPTAQAGLLECVKNLIDTRHGGHVVKRHLTELRTAQRTT